MLKLPLFAKKPREAQLMSDLTCSLSGKASNLGLVVLIPGVIRLAWPWCWQNGNPACHADYSHRSWACLSAGYCVRNIFEIVAQGLAQSTRRGVDMACYKRVCQWGGPRWACCPTRCSRGPPTTNRARWYPGAVRRVSGKTVWPRVKPCDSTVLARSAQGLGHQLLARR
jgi:hypothetical protein